MDGIDKAAVLLSHNYENFLMTGNFNTPEADSTVKDFCDICNFKYLVKELRCNKKSCESKRYRFYANKPRKQFSKFMCN